MGEIDRRPRAVVWPCCGGKLEWPIRRLRGRPRGRRLDEWGKSSASRSGSDSNSSRSASCCSADARRETDGVACLGVCVLPAEWRRAFLALCEREKNKNKNKNAENGETFFIREDPVKKMLLPVWPVPLNALADMLYPGCGTISRVFSQLYPPSAYGTKDAVRLNSCRVRVWYKKLHTLRFSSTDLGRACDSVGVWSLGSGGGGTSGTGIATTRMMMISGRGGGGGGAGKGRRERRGWNRSMTRDQGRWSWRIRYEWSGSCCGSVIGWRYRHDRAGSVFTFRTLCRAGWFRRRFPAWLPLSAESVERKSASNKKEWFEMCYTISVCARSMQ